MPRSCRASRGRSSPLPGSAGAGRRLRRLTAAVGVTIALAGCSSIPHLSPQVGTAVHDQVGQVLLTNVSLDKPAGEEYRPGDTARLRVVLFNESEQPDALTAITSPVAESVTVSLDRNCDGATERVDELRLSGNPRVNRPATSAPSGPQAPYRIEMLVNQTLRTGLTAPVTFTFRNAGTITLPVPVERSPGVQYPDGRPACEPVT